MQARFRPHHSRRDPCSSTRVGPLSQLVQPVTVRGLHVRGVTRDGWNYL